MLASFGTPVTFTSGAHPCPTIQLKQITFFFNIKSPKSPFWTCLLFLVGFLFGLLDVNGQIPSIKRFSLKDGLPQSEIPVLFQDSRGLIWIGTRGGGLVQFDGHQLKPIRITGDQNHQFIADLAEMPDGRLAVAKTYAGFSFYDNHTMLDSKGNPPVDECNKILVSGTQVYRIGNRTISKTQPGGDSIVLSFTYPQNLGQIRKARLMAERWVVIAADSGFLVVDEKLPARTLFLQRKLEAKHRRFIEINVVDQKKAILLSDQGEFSELDFSTGWPVITPIRVADGIHLEQGELLTCALFGIGLNLKWVATNQGRIISPGEQSLDLRLINEGIVPEISCMLLDKNENLWMGTEGSGVFMKNKSMVLNFNNFPRLHTHYLKAVYQSKTGDLLAGGTKTGLLLLQKSGFNLVEKHVLAGVSVFSIAEGSSFYYVGVEKGLLLLNKTTLKVEKEFATQAKVIILKDLENGKVLVGTYGDGAYKLENNRNFERINPQGSAPQYVYGFEAKDKYQYLIPSNSGLWKWTLPNNELIPLTTPDSIGKLFFMSSKDKFGTIWFSITDGLAGLKGNRWCKIRATQGLSSALIYTLNADSFGHLWVGTNSGLDRILVDENGKMLSVKNFGPSDGYEGYEANMRTSYLVGNALLIGTIEGLFQVPIGKSTLDPLPPKPTITGIMVHHKDGKWTEAPLEYGRGWFFTPPQGIEIPDASKGINFHFKAINPAIPHKIQYSFRLEGLTEQWSEPSDQNQAIFVGLKGKDFVFQVRSTYDGVSFSDPARFSFFVPKVWYQGFAVVAIISLVAAGLLIFIFSAFYKNVRRDTIIQKSSITPERMSQVLLVLALLFHPISYYFSPLGENGHYLARLIFIVNISAVILFFFSTLISAELRRKSFLFLQITFVLFISSKAVSVYISHLSPYYVVSYLLVAVLAYLVLDRFWKIILFGVFMLAFSLFCHFQIAHPLYNPILFTSSNLLVFVMLMLTLLNKKRHDTRLEFSNTVVNTGPVLVLGFKKSGELVYSSGNIFDLLGYHENDVTGKSWWTDVVQSEEETGKIKGRISSGNNGTFQVRLKKNNGSHCLYEFIVRPINEHITILMGQDITEAQALEYKFEHLVENAPDCIYQTDFYGKIVYANPQTAYLLGLSQSELIGRKFHEFIREDKRQEVLDFYTTQFRENIPATYSEYPMVTQAGHIRWLGFQVVMLNRTAEQNIEGYIAIGRDITERLETEQLIQHQHKNITDSLSYASRIKQALLPDERALKEAFSEAATINRPKDIIGGDFFWMSKWGKKQVFVLGDCTGHGVPGAFMTTIAVGLLRQIIREDFSRNCEEVLAIFNKTLTKLLATNGQSETNDFVEMALCFIDAEAGEMQFVSSGIGLHLFRKQEVISFHNGSRGLNYKVDYKGQSELIKLQPGDSFFIFTDGLFDQIGGEKHKRFTRQRLLDSIKTHANQGVESAVSQINFELESWRGDLPQIDDQLLVAFRI